MRMTSPPVARPAAALIELYFDEMTGSLKNAWWRDGPEPMNIGFARPGRRGHFASPRVDSHIQRFIPAKVYTSIY